MAAKTKRPEWESWLVIGIGVIGLWLAYRTYQADQAANAENASLAAGDSVYGPGTVATSTGTIASPAPIPVNTSTTTGASPVNAAITTQPVTASTTSPLTSSNALSSIVGVNTNA